MVLRYLVLSYRAEGRASFIKTVPQLVLGSASISCLFRFKSLLQVPCRRSCLTVSIGTAIHLDHTLTGHEEMATLSGCLANRQSWDKLYDANNVVKAWQEGQAAI